MEILSFIKEFLLGLTAENIALISILATLIIFLLGQRAERKNKQINKRKDEYKKFIMFLQKGFLNSENYKNQEEYKKEEFFDMGASLLLYGSNKVYKKYLFFRTFTTHPIIKNSKHNTKFVVLYVVADILKTIRKEIGLNGLMNIEDNDVLAFFVNDINQNPYSKVQEYKTRYDILMLKVEIFMADIVNFVLIKKIYYLIVKPIFGIFLKISLWIIIRPLTHIIFSGSLKKMDYSENKIRFENQMSLFSFLLFFFSVFSFEIDLFEKITENTIIGKGFVLFVSIIILLFTWIVIDKRMSKSEVSNLLWKACDNTLPGTTIILYIIFYIPIEACGVTAIIVWGIKAAIILLITIYSLVIVNEKFDKYKSEMSEKIKNGN